MKKYNCPDCQMVESEMTRNIDFCIFCNKISRTRTRNDPWGPPNCPPYKNCPVFCGNFKYSRCHPCHLGMDHLEYNSKEYKTEILSGETNGKI